MSEIPCCNWLPDWARWGCLAHSGLSMYVSHKKSVFFMPHKKSFVDLLVLLKKLDIDLILFYVIKDVNCLSVYNIQLMYGPGGNS